MESRGKNGGILANRADIAIKTMTDIYICLLINIAIP
jgi:hypothetical protein